MAVEVGEGQLRARVRSLAPADQPGALRPAVEVDCAGQLRNPRALALLAVPIARRPPR
jgi:hypothetical protein